MSIKCCLRPSKATHFRQSKKTDFPIYALSSGITTHFQPKLFLSNGASNIKCVSQGSFTEKVEVSELLPTRVHITENPTLPSFSPWRDKPLREKFFFGFTACTPQTCTARQQPRLHGRPGAAAKQSVCSLSWCSWAAQGLSFASLSITLCNVLRHDQVIPRDTQFIC